jgi:hypothetical protein
MHYLTAQSVSVSFTHSGVPSRSNLYLQQTPSRNNFTACVFLLHGELRTSKVAARSMR